MNNNIIESDKIQEFIKAASDNYHKDIYIIINGEYYTIKTDNNKAFRAGKLTALFALLKAPGPDPDDNKII